MSDPRIIKKYPNRRLYDTTVSSYITLEDVRKLVMSQEEFCVVDARSKEDITRSILLQIILEQEEDGEPIFTQQVLAQIIRFYGDALQGTLTRYLERSFGLFVEQQTNLGLAMPALARCNGTQQPRSDRIDEALPLAERRRADRRTRCRISGRRLCRERRW